MIFAAISFESSTVMMTAPALAYKSRLRPLNYRAELSLIGGKIQQAQWGWAPLNTPEKNSSANMNQI